MKRSWNVSWSTKEKRCTFRKGAEMLEGPQKICTFRSLINFVQNPSSERYWWTDMHDNDKANRSLSPSILRISKINSFGTVENNMKSVVGSDNITFGHSNPPGIVTAVIGLDFWGILSFFGVLDVVVPICLSSMFRLKQSSQTTNRDTNAMRSLVILGKLSYLWVCWWLPQM